jgi:hypothetical protein
MFVDVADYYRGVADHKRVYRWGDLFRAVESDPASGLYQFRPSRVRDPEAIRAHLREIGYVPTPDGPVARLLGE